MDTKIKNLVMIVLRNLADALPSMRTPYKIVLLIVLLLAGLIPLLSCTYHLRVDSDLQQRVLVQPSIQSEPASATANKPGRVD